MYQFRDFQLKKYTITLVSRGAGEQRSRGAGAKQKIWTD
jgi:hypothetical protein